MATRVPEEHEADGATCYPRRSTLLAVVAIGLVTFSTVAIATSRGEFQRLFAEFDLPLSALTSALLSPVFSLAMVVIAVLTIAKEFVPRANSIANIWNAVVIGVAITSLVMFMIAVFAPLTKLIESLS